MQLALILVQTSRCERVAVKRRIGIAVVFLSIWFPLAAQQPKSAGGEISGTVLESSSDRPIDNVEVSLYNPVGETLGAITDRQGAFKLNAVPPGRYDVSLKKQGLSMARPSNLKIPMAFSVWVSVKDNDSQRLELRMVPTGVITGRVLDSHAQPIKSVVFLGIHGYDENGADTVRIVGDSTHNFWSATNDRGEYRRFGIEPGKYVLIVSPALTGGPFGGNAAKFPLTYFPGSIEPSRAVAINVAPDQEIHLGDVAIQPYEGSKVTLHFIDNENPDFRSIFYRPMLGFPLGYSVRGASELVIPSMPPGHFNFFVQNDGGEVDTQLSVGRSFARVELTLNGSDVEKTVYMSKGFHVSGTVQVEDSNGRRAPAAGVSVSLKPVNEGPRYILTVQESGTWVLDHAAPGRYKVDIGNLPSGSYLASAVSGNKDVLDGIEITGDTSLDMVARAGAGNIEGVVFDGGQHPIGSAVVVLLPDPPSPRRPHLIRQVVSDVRGTFRLEGLSPGSYRAYAWRELESNAYLNSEFMKPYIGKGVPVRIVRGGSAEVHVTALE